MPNPGDYQVEYAKSGRSKCNITFKNIANGALRIGLYYESEYGVIAKWYDFDAFEKDAGKVNELRSSGAKIIGLSDLKPKDKQRIEQITAGFIATTAVPMIPPPVQTAPPVLAMPTPVLPTSLPAIPTLPTPPALATPSYKTAKTPAKKVTPPKKSYKKQYESEEEDDFIDDEEEEASAEEDSAEEEEESEEEEKDTYRGRGRRSYGNNYKQPKTTAFAPTTTFGTTTTNPSTTFTLPPPATFTLPPPQTHTAAVTFGATTFAPAPVAVPPTTTSSSTSEIRTNKQLSSGTKRPFESDDDSDEETMAGVYDQVERSSKKRRKLVQKNVSKLTPGDYNMSFLQYMARTCPPNYTKVEQFEDWCPDLENFATRVKDLNGAEIQLLLARLITQWKRSGEQEQITKLKKTALQIIQERNTAVNENVAK